MASAALLEAALRRDRQWVLAGLAGIAILSWAYTLYLAWAGQSMDAMEGMKSMEGMAMSGMAMPSTRAWSLVDAVLMFAMWAIMMVAMMIPSAAPMILLFARVSRQRREQARPYVPVAVFALGYWLIWSGFSLLATLANWGLHSGGLLSSMMGRTTPVLGGVLLMAAGLYQWSPLKQACLAHCRSPLDFVMSEWREGAVGALGMGARHGAYCLGCCWVLMLLLFVLGVMNLLWIAALAVFVLLEKVIPSGPWLGRVAGLLFLGWGVWLIVGRFLVEL